MPQIAPPPSPSPRRLVLLGHPVAHSLSPTFQNAALARGGVALRYEALDVPAETLHAVLDEIRQGEWAGNVTIPHKRAVREACDVLTPIAHAVGAVNTFWCSDGALVGDNTDVAGARAALAEVVNERGQASGAAPPVARLALIGAGGAAAAVACAVAAEWPHARVLVWTRRRTQGEALAARFSGHVRATGDLQNALGDADVVVNATPIGLVPGDALPCPIDALAPGCAVLDTVYGPGETRWVRDARAAGHAARDGLTMLVEQGAHAFARWFGHAPDRRAMWDAVRERTGRLAGPAE